MCVLILLRFLFTTRLIVIILIIVADVNKAIYLCIISVKINLKHLQHYKTYYYKRINSLFVIFL